MALFAKITFFSMQTHWHPADSAAIAVTPDPAQQSKTVSPTLVYVLIRYSNNEQIRSVVNGWLAVNMKGAAGFAIRSHCSHVARASLNDLTLKACR